MEETIINTLIAKWTPSASKIWKKGAGGSLESYSLLIGAAKYLCPDVAEDKILQGICDGHGDRDIDALILDAENKTVSIFDAEGSNVIGWKELQSYLKNIDEYVFGSKSADTFCRPDLIGDVRKAIDKSWKINIYVVRSKNVKKETLSRTSVELNKLKSEYSNVLWAEAFDATRLTDLIIGEPLNKIKFEWLFESYVEDGEAAQILAKEYGVNKSLFVRVRLLEILKLRDEYEKKGFNLFEANVRGFQGKRELSDGVLLTLRTKPKHFYKYHNGITFSCKGIMTRGKNKYTILNPQVINGCQTVGTLYDEYKGKGIDGALLQNASVLCKFYSLSDADIEKVCEATNTQLKINNWDLRANDPVQKKIELILHSRALGYKRKAGRSPSRLSVALTSLGQWLYACKHGQPADAKNKKKQIFDAPIDAPSIYETIYGKHLKKEEILDVFRIGQEISEIIKNRKIKERKKFEKHANFHSMAAIYHVWRMKPEKTRESGITETFIRRKYALILPIVRKVANKIATQKGLEVTESLNYVFTKEASTWKEIKRRLHR